MNISKDESELVRALKGMLELERHTHRIPGSINEEFRRGVVEDAEEVIRKFEGRRVEVRNLNELLAPTSEDNPTVDGIPLETYAARYAAIALINLPDAYESRKRIITTCIMKAMSGAQPKSTGESLPKHLNFRRD